MKRPEWWNKHDESWARRRFLRRLARATSYFVLPFLSVVAGLFYPIVLLGMAIAAIAIVLFQLAWESAERNDD